MHMCAYIFKGMKDGGQGAYRPDDRSRDRRTWDRIEIRLHVDPIREDAGLSYQRAAVCDRSPPRIRAGRFCRVAPRKPRAQARADLQQNRIRRREQSSAVQSSAVQRSAE